MNKQIIWEIHGNKGPIVATAIHDGHKLRREVEELSAVEEVVRFREEDPFTGGMTNLGALQIIGTHSRFQVDLNRPRDKAVYIRPEDAWGLEVCRYEPPQDLLDRSLTEYDSFYSEVHKIFLDLENQFGKFVVFDIHSYNHMRDGADKPAANIKDNPEVNIGTGSVNIDLWGPLVKRFISDLSNYDFYSRRLDVRENVKFKGGEFSRWTHKNFPESGCSLSIEFKKFFMDEWSGEPDMDMLDKIRMALGSTIPGVKEELIKLGARW